MACPSTQVDGAYDLPDVKDELLGRLFIRVGIVELDAEHIVSHRLDMEIVMCVYSHRLDMEIVCV